MLPLSPSKLGRYEIVDEIGKGAMGVVYLARDPLIGRLVALKTFRISYSVKDAELDQFRARFIREAQSAGILSHPNIVTIHDVVERGEEGLAFIAMEYVRGTNLKSVLQEPQRPTLTFASEILTQIADGLDYAHSCKVIHRDIKPANILITAENRAKITDFGIARLDTSNLTQEGQLLGTPNYMSPEQILGRDVDHRADIFSLGVVLYEMVTRHKPFQGENLTVVSHRIVYDHFTPPRQYADDLPPGTEQILAKALEKDPGRRYQRARDMAEDLRRVLGSVGVRDALNETQSLSTTAMLPASLLQPMSPAIRPGAPSPQPGTPATPAISGMVHPFPMATPRAAAPSAVPPLALAGAAAAAVAEQAEPGEDSQVVAAAPWPLATPAPAAVPAGPELAAALPGPGTEPQPRPQLAPPPPPAPRGDTAAAPAPASGAAPGAVVYPHATRPMAAPPELVAAGATGAKGTAGSTASAAAPAATAGQPEPVPAALPESPAEGPGAALTAETLPPLPAAPAPRPGWSRGLLALPSPVRLAAAAAAGLAVGLLLAAGLAVWQRSGQAPDRQGSAAARPEAAEATRVQVMGLVRDGRHRLETGDADGAAAAFRAAEQLLPGRRGLRRLREDAERQQTDRRQRIDQERTIGAKLDEGRLELADRHYPEAEAAAQAVLAMSPGNTVAEEILASVKAGRAHSRDRAALAEARQQAHSVAVAAPPVRPDAAPRSDQAGPSSAAEVKDATLELAFFSQLPEGSLLVYVNDRKVLQQDFRFYEKGSFFRSHPSTGWVRQSFRVPAGDAVIRLYITPHGSAAVVRTFKGNFPGGTSRRLDAKLTGDGDVAAQLN
ncbi:MAG TPA: serine/threonine-protein kinase [Thermoanaerobaculia bacterium]|jgi:serine/threonine-protein kinase|nr:serine/threonine-protein kinase [Thermoanaerobaculia bacterium]